MQKLSQFLAIAAILAQVSLNAPVEYDETQIAFRPQNMRLLATAEDRLEWADPEVLMNKGIKFMDKTDHLDLEDRAEETSKRLSKYKIPAAPKHEREVLPFLKKIDTSRMKERLTTFTGFKNRYYKSSTGVESAQWLKTTIESIIESTGVKATVKEFGHSWSQPSLIVRFNGKVVDGEDAPIVVVGSHQDTVRGGWFTDGRAPGADDDGSGSMTTLEAFTVLCEQGFYPSRPVEFHWYSAEEMGLLGSQDVAKSYQRANKDVVAMIQFDMTGYAKKNVFGIITDHVDQDLTGFLKSIATKYGELDVVETKCGYACSDHASWKSAGYRSAFPFEGAFSDSSPYIHGKDDTVEHVDFDHMKEFVKLAISFAVELGETMD